MQEPRQNLHLPAPPLEKIAILLVSSDPEDVGRLKNILHHPNWHVSRCSGAVEAARSLVAEEHAVVICERELADGNWYDLLECALKLDRPPLLLVMSKQADERLWSEVLNLGGYDVLLKPFDRSEVTRVVSMAWRQWCGVHRRSATGASGGVPHWV